MRFVALLSGGKDSIYSIRQCQKYGHTLVGCIHLGRPMEDDEESYMYQTAGSEVLQIMVEECIGVPFLYYQRQGKSINTALVYEKVQNDEVEDLFEALSLAQQQWEFEAVASGAILSTYQRTRIENVCSRLNLTSLSYLWRRATQQELLQHMIDDPIEAVLVRVAAPPGLKQHHLGKSIAELQHHFQTLFDRYQFHVCGEGGEYETIVLDAPIFRRKLVLDETKTEFDGESGILRILSCHSEAKEIESGVDASSEIAVESDHATTELETTKPEATSRIQYKVLASVCQSPGGLLHFAPITSTLPSRAPDEATAAVEEALQIFETLQYTLKYYEATAQDVILVHLYLSEISHFKLINEHYRNVFGVILPPSRSCVAIGKQALSGKRVRLDCLVVCGSGSYMRGKADCEYSKAALAMQSPRLRRVLHVQSLSSWAPVCVGPYSQVNTIKDSIHYVAGQIGLIPESMTLHRTIDRQLEQSWVNLARILDALDAGSLQNVLSGLVYVSQKHLSQEYAKQMEKISKEMISSNASVLPGAVDNLLPSDVLQGYEDEETMLELAREHVDDVRYCPLLLVAIPEMPVGALVELEVSASTTAAAKYLGVHDKEIQEIGIADTKEPVDWETGHNVLSSRREHRKNLSFRAHHVFLGSGSATYSLVDVSATDPLNLELNEIMAEMVNIYLRGAFIEKVFQKTLLNVRVYYRTDLVPEDILHALLSREFAIHGHLPSFTIVGTAAVFVVDFKNTIKESIIAFQAKALDIVQLESEFWVKNGRA